MTLAFSMNCLISLCSFLSYMVSMNLLWDYYSVCLCFQIRPTADTIEKHHISALFLGERAGPESHLTYIYYINQCLFFKLRIQMGQTWPNIGILSTCIRNKSIAFSFSSYLVVSWVDTKRENQIWSWFKFELSFVQSGIGYEPSTCR